ncbi:TrkH family potassium uptake protein [Paenibacillus sp. NPDC058071]|uniref:TrkH family potassium uptake protein n=1 Tax=Paenibacillus sp. NPDC058071 TaxID=3346326 RepID=UPI0036DA5607
MLSFFDIRKWSPPRILVSGFAVIILIGAVLLMTPLALSEGAELRFLDALFMATSAVSVTGLAVVDTGTFFSTPGQIILLLLIQIGGLGFMTTGTLIALMLRKRISLRERLILQEAMNQTSMQGIVKLVRKVIVYSLLIEASGWLLLSIRFAFDMPLGKAIYFGLFHSVSLFNNAGFDIFGQFRSMTDYVGDPLINIVSMLLIVLGGLGFVVISDLLDWRNCRKLTLHSKVVLTTTGLLIAVGAIVIFIFEFSNANTLGSLNAGEKVLASLFQSVAPRTAGANTLDYSAMRQATLFFTVILMFIGASSGSTGGGIKTTTFATLIGAVLAMVRGRQDIVMFRYRLAKDRIYKALTITMLSVALVIFVTMLLSTTEDQQFMKILFEATSAFGTVGLSAGLTPHLTDFGRVIIMFTMFAGRLGPLTLAYALGPKTEKELYRYPEGKITIG